MTGHHPLLGANRHAPLHLTPTESYRAHSPVHDEIRTIFISGFPHNILSRELNNLLRFLPGYEASQLCFKDGKPHGFAMFTTHAMALAAISQLSNVVFDNSEVYPSILRAEIARSNIACLESSPKQTKLNSASSSAIQQPNYKHYAPQQPASYSTLQYQTPTKTASDYHPYFTTSNTQSRAPSLSPPPPSSVSHSQRQYKSVTNDNDNAPCNTLFVGKMGDTVQESELLELFRYCFFLLLVFLKDACCQNLISFFALYAVTSQDSSN